MLEDVLNEFDDFTRDQIREIFDSWPKGTGNLVRDTVLRYHRKRDVLEALIRGHKEGADVTEVARRFQHTQFRVWLDNELDNNYLDCLFTAVRIRKKFDVYLVRNCLEVHRNRPQEKDVTNSLMNLCYSENGAALTRVIQMHIQYLKHEDSVTVAQYMNKQVHGNSSEAELIAEVFMKYPEHAEQIMTVEKPYSLGLQEMLTNRAQKEIRYNPGIINKIFDEYIGNTSIEIKDDFVYQNCTYRDLKLLTKTFKLISRLHNKRKQDDKARIFNEFYAQMHRAIKQNKNKLQNFRDYLHEVLQAMYANAADLMVVHNA